MCRRDDRVSVLDATVYAKDMPSLIEQLESIVKE